MTDNNENQELNSVKETKNNFNLLKEVWEWFYTIVIALLVVIFIKGFIFVFKTFCCTMLLPVVACCVVVSVVGSGFVVVF